MTVQSSGRQQCRVALFHSQPGVHIFFGLCCQPVPCSIDTPDKCPNHYRHLCASLRDILLRRTLLWDSLRAQRMSSCTKSSSFMLPKSLKNGQLSDKNSWVKNWKSAAKVLSHLDPMTMLWSPEHRTRISSLHWHHWWLMWPPKGEGARESGKMQTQLSNFMISDTNKGFSIWCSVPGLGLLNGLPLMANH